MPTKETHRRFPIARPGPHFMGLAPLDIWLRLLINARLRIAPRYWLRLGVNLFYSAFGTIITLPERLALWPILWWRFRGKPTLTHKPGVVVVLGYFRSGTTHLHYLLSCDRRMYTPRWRQAAAPQGFILVWWVLRWALVPFMGNERPHDAMAFGPEYPAEDDFAVNNWALASSLPGRFVLPKRRDHWARYHDLRGLTERELSRWRRCQAAFLWKIGLLARGRMILLKSPSHTARVEQLVRLLGRDNVRFVHIAREPTHVLRSNETMYRRLATYALQDPPAEEETREYLIDEYARSERLFLEQTQELDHVARVRFADLVADPVGQMRRIYDELGIAWTERSERDLLRYLRQVREHRVATTGDGPSDPRLDEIRRSLDLDRPPVPEQPLPDSPDTQRTGGQAAGGTRGLRGWITALLVAVACAAAWLGVCNMTHHRRDAYIWLTGLIVGAATIRVARVGSTKLGLWAATLTLLVYALGVFPATYFAYAHDWPYDAMFHTRKNIGESVLSPGNQWLFLALGVLTAYRYASRKHLHAPGR